MYKRQIVSNSQPLSLDKVYPVPARDKVTAMLVAEKSGQVVVTLQSVSGKTMLTKKQTLAKGTNEVMIDLSTFAAGVYILGVSDSNGNYQSVKIVKQ